MVRRTTDKKHMDRDELVQLMTCDILNGMSKYRVKLKLQRDKYEDFVTSKFSERKIYYLLEEAYNNCKIPLAKDRQKMRELFISRYEDILEEARDARDRQNAINALKEMGKILGIYEPEKVDVTGAINVNIDFGLGNGSES